MPALCPRGGHLPPSTSVCSFAKDQHRWVLVRKLSSRTRGCWEARWGLRHPIGLEFLPISLLGSMGGEQAQSPSRETRCSWWSCSESRCSVSPSSPTDTCLHRAPPDLQTSVSPEVNSSGNHRVSRSPPTTLVGSSQGVHCMEFEDRTSGVILSIRHSFSSSSS